VREKKKEEKRRKNLYNTIVMSYSDTRAQRKWNVRLALEEQPS
jgi:hypothetical protein